MIAAPQRSAPHFDPPLCTAPPVLPPAGPQLPDAWAPPPRPDVRPLIDGDVTRKVNGYTVHCIHGEDYLSTSTVLSIMRWGDLSHVDPFALEYGRQRGSYVDQACRCHDTHCLDWDALDPKLRPYVDAWSLFKTQERWQPERCEDLVLQEWPRTFGYRDRFGCFELTATTLDIKTSDHIGQSYRLQLASYLTGPRERAAAVQLKKDGTYELHWLEHAMAWRKRFEVLAWEAHEYIREEELRSGLRADKKRKRA